MRYYTDDEIRGMLIERKGREKDREFISSLLGGLGLFVGGYLWYILLYAIM